MALTLYVGNKNYSSWSMRPWVALRSAGIAFDEVLIPLDRSETRAQILAVNPAGRVPALRDGETLVWDSLAICEYAAERFPQAQLWPGDVRSRATARSVSAEMHSGFSALRTAMPMNLRRAPTPIAHSDEVTADIERVVSIWSEFPARYASGGPFLFGAFTIADAMFAPVVGRFRSYGVVLPPQARTYADAVWAHAAVRAWVDAGLEEELSMPRYEGANAR